jgi:hypothetical protein
MVQGKLVGFFLHEKTAVGVPGYGVSDSKGFEDVADSRPEDGLVFGIKSGGLVAVVHVNGDLSGFDPHGVVDGVGVTFFKEQVLIVVSQYFVESAGLEEPVKDLVEPGPAFFNQGQGVALEFFDVAVEHQVPVLFIVIIVEEADHQLAVGGEVVAAAGSHVEVADDEGLSPPGQVQNRGAVKPGAEYFAEKTVVHAVPLLRSVTTLKAGGRNNKGEKGEVRSFSGGFRRD